MESELSVLENATSAIPILSNVFGSELQISLVFTLKFQFDLSRHVAHRTALLTSQRAEFYILKLN